MVIIESSDPWYSLVADGTFWVGGKGMEKPKLEE